MDKDLEKYRHLKEFLGMSASELQKLTRMVDSLLEYVEDRDTMRSSPELCNNVRDMAVRIRSMLRSRLVALEDLIIILGEYGIKI
ncbi:MAG: hypothetical protein ABFD81_15045 [Syntrophaceae bacterium]